MAHAAGKADGGFCRKILRSHGACKAEQSQRNEQHTARHDIAFVAAGDAGIDDVRHNERHQKLQKRLQKLEKRSEDALQRIGF